MSDKRYPTRMHEALRVETGEVFDCEGRTWTISESGVLSIVNKRPGCYEVVGPSAVCLMINHPERITRHPRLTEEAQEKEDHIIRLERMRSQKDQLAKGKHAHWLKTPADHAKERDALDAAIEALTGKSRLTDEQMAQLKALVTLGFKWLAKQRKGYVMFFQKKPHKNAIWFSGTGDEEEDYGVVLPNDTHLSSLVSWYDPEPLDIVQTLRDAGEEVNDA